MLNNYFESYALSHTPYKGGAWCYEDGCIYRGLELLHQATGEQRWLKHLIRLIEPQITEGPRLLKYEANDYNIDNILPGRSLLYLHSVTGDSSYLETAQLLSAQLETQPRTHSGVYWHKLRYPWQVWLDGLYMAAPFQIEYGRRTGQQFLVDDSLRQLNTALDMAYVPETDLYAHAVDEARKQPWVNRDTGQSAAHWSRALGWLAMALVDVAALTNDHEFALLKPRSEKFLAKLLSLRVNDGLWLQVIDRSDLAGNYQESSASAMFTYALLRGGKLGLCKNLDQNLLSTLFSHTLIDKQGGGHEMTEICEVAGLGMYEDRFRDGSAEYYLSEKRVADDAKGVGPLMMCHAVGLST